MSPSDMWKSTPSSGRYKRVIHILLTEITRTTGSCVGRGGDRGPVDARSAPLAEARTVRRRLYDRIMGRRDRVQAAFDSGGLWMDRSARCADVDSKTEHRASVAHDVPQSACVSRVTFRLRVGQSGATGAAPTVLRIHDRGCGPARRAADCVAFRERDINDNHRSRQRQGRRADFTVRRIPGIPALHDGSAFSTGRPAEPGKPRFISTSLFWPCASHRSRGSFCSVTPFVSPLCCISTLRRSSRAFIR